MTTTTVIDQATAAPTIGLADARFISLATYRRTGECVANPVLFAMDGDRLLVRTAHDAGKLKRLAHTSRVDVTPCDQRGRPLGMSMSGHARALGPEAVAPTLARLHARYRIAGPVFTTLRHLRGKRDVVIEIVLDATR